MTRQGWFSDEDLHAAQARVTWTAEGAHVVFPIGYRNTGFDAITGKVIQDPVYPPLGIENAAKRREIAEQDGHTTEARAERYKQARKDFERLRESQSGPRRAS